MPSFNFRFLGCVAGFFILVVGGPMSGAFDWAWADSKEKEGQVVGRFTCVNGTNDGFGDFTTPVPQQPNHVTVIQCRVPKWYKNGIHFIKIESELDEACLDDQLGTAVRVGPIWAQPDPEGTFRNECTENAFETRSRLWYVVPDNNNGVRADDMITVEAQSEEGMAGTVVGPSRVIIVDIVRK